MTMNWEQHFRAMRRQKSSVEFGADFGGMVRGTVPPGVTGAAVIPPGRYWLDAYGDKISRFQVWAKGKPEVRIESSSEDVESVPPHLFVIFVIPPTSNNFGMPGVLFPTADLGFPESAPAAVQSSDDVVQRPPVPTVASTLADAGQVGSSLLGQISPRTIMLGALALGAVIFVATFPGTLLRKAL